MSVLQQTVSLAAQLRAFSSLLSLPSQAQSVIKALRRQGIGFADEFNTARFLLSRLESLSAAPTSLSFLRFRSKSSKSSKGGQSWPLRAQRRDSVIYSAPLPLHSINPTDSPDTRINVMALVVLSDSLCLWRKDPYLPSRLLSVRHLPRTNVLASYGICGQFPHLHCRRENRPQTP